MYFFHYFITDPKSRQVIQRKFKSAMVSFVKLEAYVFIVSAAASLSAFYGLNENYY